MHAGGEAEGVRTKPATWSLLDDLSAWPDAPPIAGFVLMLAPY